VEIVLMALWKWRRDGAKRRDRIERLVGDAITTLENMVVDCTRSLREDEASEIGGRRQAALAYLYDAYDLLSVPDVYDPSGGLNRG
jgi:hypothetical protein